MLQINLMAVYLAGLLHEHRARGDDRGETGEVTVTGVIWIALFAAATIAVVAIIVAKVKGKANSIPMD